MKLSLIVENKTYEENITAEHGLSLLIESDEKVILFDSGATDALIRNAKTMGIDLSKVNLAFLSHGHYDHSGGFPAFGEINKASPIYIHENAFNEAYEIGKDGKPYGPNLGIRWSDEEKAALKNQIICNTEPVYVSDNIIISGSIPEQTREFTTERFLIKSGNGENEYETDTMAHEQFLIIIENNELFVFTGCCHTGVKPVVDYTKKLFPDKKIKLLFGGFHLYSSPKDILLNASERITSLDVEYFLPVHCTGLNATFRMKELLGERCIILNAGDKLYF